MKKTMALHVGGNDNGDNIDNSDSESLAVAEKYCPLFCEDENEPFGIVAVGYTIITEDGKAPTSKYEIKLERMFAANGADAGKGMASYADTDEGVRKCKARYAIEYAVFWDFDIEHLYDLEHVYVYVDENDEVCDVVSSFHGKFYRSMWNGMPKFSDNHPVLYLQPGKHGVMPSPELFNLYGDLVVSCNESAGSAGFLVADMFRDDYETDAEFDEKVRQYVKDHYAFTPSMKFKKPQAVNALCTCGELKSLIVKRMREWKSTISQAE